MADGDAIKGMAAANDEGFQNRVKYYMQKGAAAVIGELNTTPGHVERKAYADGVFDGTESVFEMAVAVVTNGTIITNIGAQGGHTAVTDADIEFTVNSLWDDFSGFEA